MRKQVFSTAILLALVFVWTEVRAQVKFSPSKSEYRIGEELVVNYANLPAPAKGQFYLVLVLANNGTDLHDSRQIANLPGGSLKFKRLIKPGNFQAILYKYEDKNDQRPEQISRIPFTAVSRVFALNEGVATRQSEEEGEKTTAKADPPRKEAAKPAPRKEPAKKVVAKAESKKKESVKVSKPAVSQEVEPEIDSIAEQQQLVKDSLEDAEEVNEILTTVVSGAEQVNAAPPPPTYNLTYKSNIQENDNIAINYQFPVLTGNRYYKISVHKQGVDSATEVTSPFKRNLGSATISPAKEAGIYELRVLRGSADEKEEVLHSQPLVVGVVNKQYPGRYSCIPKKPVVAGTEVRGGPTFREATDTFIKATAGRHLRPWITMDDICVELQGIEFLPQSVVTFPPANSNSEEISYPAYPIRFIYRVVLNDYTIPRSSVVEEARFKYQYFYKHPQKGWMITDKPGTQLDELGSR